MSPDSFTNIEEFATELARTMVGVAPEAYAVATRIVRFESISHAVVGFIALAALYIVGRWIALKLRAVEGDLLAIESSGTFVGIIFGVVLCVVALVFAVATLLNIWVWVGMFNPELRLAREALNALLK